MMGKIHHLLLVVWAACLFMHLQAQDLETLLAPLDKSQIPTGILYESGNNWLDVEAFQAQVSQQQHKANISEWRGIYLSLYSGQIAGNNALPALASLNTEMQNHGDKIVLPLAYLAYNKFRPDALDANLLWASSTQLHDVAGRSQSPYQNLEVFALAPSQSQSREGTVTFRFPSSLFVSNTGTTLASLEADFGDGGGYRSVAWDTDYVLNYASAGTKTLRFRAAFSNGKSFTSQSELEVLTVQAAARYDEIADNFFIVNPTANHAGGVAFIEYSTRNPSNQIRKPLIVVEGYDPNNDSNFRGFIENINFADDGIFNFNQSLDEIGEYDIIYVNYNFGADHIARNAALLEEVITRVNTLKTTSEQNVVLGISMGGLVARYGLANMVSRGIPTDTRLLITHDSPHQGANVPLGLQALLHQLNESPDIRNLAPEVQEGLDLLTLPATQEMLLVRATDGSGGLAYNTFLDNVYQPMVNRAVPYQVIATSQGAECGQAVMPPLQKMIEADASAGLGFLFTQYLSGGVRAKFEVFSLPEAGNRQRIAHSRIWRETHVLFFKFTKELFSRSYMSPIGLPNWDSAPGGIEDITNFVGAEDLEGLPNSSFWVFIFGGVNSNLSILQSTFCFVPTVSALDIQDINNNTITAPYSSGISIISPSRLDNFMTLTAQGNTFNERHIRFTARQSEWLFEMMENGSSTLNCSAVCGVSFEDLGGSITGAEAVCKGNVTYNIVPNASIPANSQYTWSITGPLELVSGQGSSEIQVRTTGVGKANLTVQIHAGCQSFEVSRGGIVSDDLRPFTPSISGTPEVCYESIFGIAGIPPTELGAFAIHWTADEPIDLESPLQLEGFPDPHSGPTIKALAGEDAIANLNVTLNSPCRSSTLAASLELQLEDSYMNWNATDFLNEGDKIRLSDLPAGASIVWSSNKAYVSAGQGSLEATFDVHSPGQGWVKAEIWTAACGYRVFEKTIYADVPAFTIPPAQYPNGICNNPYHPTAHAPGAVNVTQTNHVAVAHIPYGTSRSYTITAVAHYPDGSTVTKSQNFTYWKPSYCSCNSCGGGGGGIILAPDDAIPIANLGSGEDSIALGVDSLLLTNTYLENDASLTSTETAETFSDSSEAAAALHLSPFIYPNPATETVTLDLGTWYQEGQVSSYRLYNYQGVLQSEGSFQTKTTELSLNNFASGTYLLYVQDGLHLKTLSLVVSP